MVVSEPDRPVNVFSFGPRVFVSSRDLDALGLVRTGSRITWQTLLKVLDEGRIDAVAGRLRQAAQSDREQVDTYRTARTRVKRFLDNFIFFLNLIGMFILIIAGMGIQNTLTAFFNEKQQTIAVMKTVGASNRRIIGYFMPMVFLLGLLGTVMGISTGIRGSIRPDDGCSAPFSLPVRRRPLPGPVSAKAWRSVSRWWPCLRLCPSTV